MKKRLASILLTVCMVLAMLPGATLTAGAASIWDGTVPASNAAYAFSGGDGTAESPYLINTAADLAQLAVNINAGINYTNKIFVQTADIDLNGGVTFTFEADTGLVTVSNGTNTFYIGTGTAGDGSGANATFDVTPGTAGTIYSSNTTTAVGTDNIGLHAWTPIGTSAYRFMGYFKGQSYTIRGIYINDTGATHRGLFGYAQGSISNIGVSNSFILGASYTGGIAGYASTTIRNCFNTGIIVGADYVGGITGKTDGGGVYNCYNAAKVIGTRYVGGITGFANGMSQYCYSTDTAYGTNYVGSVVGLHDFGFVLYCGTIDGTQKVIAGTSAECGGYGDQTLLSGLTSGTSTLLQALNAWVVDQNQNYNYTWKADSENTNSGYPIKDAAYVPATVPGAPTAVTATAGDTQASVSFTAPSSNGGAVITGYTVTVSPADVPPVNGVGSPIVVTGLTNGQAYTFTVSATNSVGTGASSAVSNSITPAMSQTITFLNPGPQTFGTTPTLSATADSGLTVTFTSSTPDVATITPEGTLTFISAGTATINANQAGNGSYLAASEVSRTFAVNPIVPGAPTGVTATAGATQASVSFTAPASNGGAAITGYTVTSSPIGFTATGVSSPITITGLTNGQAYTFTMTATNSAGTSVPSSASNSVTPQAPAPSSGGGGGSPTIVTKIDSGETVAKTNVDKLVQGGKDLTVEGKTGEKLVFDTEALKSIDDQSKDIVKVEIKDVSADYKNEHPDRLVVSLTVTAGGKHITNFGNGTATVSLPYELKPGEKAADVTVWYLAEDGSMTEVPCTYDPVTKLATFKVNHFSLYVVGTADLSTWANPFGDVKQSDWFYGAVRYASANGLMQGTKGTAFSPDTYMTRGMLVTILWRMENEPAATAAADFTDIAAGKWYTQAVTWAAKNEIVTGHAGKFNPDDAITREQLAAILHRYATYKDYVISKGANLDAYPDTPSDWALSSVSWAVAEGLLQGSGGRLAPEAGATRAQAATVLQRFIETIVN